MPSTLTILQQPQDFTPAYNNNPFVVTSTNNGQPSFKYVAKMYIGGNVIVEKSAPNPTYGSAYFNPARMIESLVKFDIDNTVYGFQTNSKSIKNYYVEFYEEYEIAGVITQSALKATSNTIKIWNGIIDFYNYASYDYTGYMIDNGRILNHTLAREVRLDDNGWIYYLADDVTSLQQNVTISAFDFAGGTLLNQVVLDNPFQTNGTLTHHAIRFDSAPNGLNSIDPSQIFSGTQPIIAPECTYYEIDFDLPKNLLLPFYVVENSCKYETFRLHYQNNLGAFESFNFMLASKHTETIKRENYKGVVGGLTAYDNFGYSISDRSTTNFFTSIKDIYKIRTNWLTEEYKEVLEQLVSSPVVYWDNPNYGLVPIDITTNVFEFDQKVTKKNFNLELDFELSHDRYRQRN
jgi:hypothetical protein